jgi:hypothetical protein
MVTVSLNELFADAEMKRHEELTCVIELARSLHSIVDVRDRYRDLELHSNVFVGTEAIECLRHWLHHRHLPASREDGKRAFEQLLRAGMVVHEACALHPTPPDELYSPSFFTFDDDALDGAQARRASAPLWARPCARPRLNITAAMWLTVRTHIGVTRMAWDRSTAT